MKKILTVLLVLTLVVGAVFADKSRVTIESEVAEKQPAYVLKAGLTQGTYGTTGVAATTAEESFDGAVLATGVPSIADGNVVVYFQILQTGSAGKDEDTNKTFARYKDVVIVNVSIGDLICEQQDGTLYRIPGAPSYGTDSADITKPKAASIKILKNFASANSYNYSATYNGKVYDDKEIATFTATWEKDEYAPNGTYKADITLTYTIS